MNHKNIGFIEFTRMSAEYMMGSGAIRFYICLPLAWIKFDRLQRKDDA